jgi:hypothetical protein
MPRKLSTLPALSVALRLQAFTLSHLAEQAGVPVSSAQAVVRRCPVSWFASPPPHPLEVDAEVALSLTSEGQGAIRQLLAELVETSLLPALAPLDEPPGLLAARADFERLPFASPQLREIVIGSALGYLDWVDAALADGDYAEQAARVRAEVDTLRERLLQVRTSGSVVEPTGQ